MRPIDGVGTLNPALTSQAFVREVEGTSKPAPKPEAVSETTKSYAVATGPDRGDAGVFRPVVGATENAEADLPNTYKSSQGNLDVFL